MVAEGGQYTYRLTITPNITCSANIYGRTDRRVGCSLRRAHCKRNLVPSGKQAAYKLSRTKKSLSGFKRVPRPFLKQDSSNRQHHSSVIHKQGRRHEVGSTLCPTMENLDLVYQETSDSKARHFPGRLNVVADKLSRLGQTIQTEWFLLPEVFHSICSRWHWPKIDLFATRFNNKLPLCHWYRIPWPQQWMRSVDHGRIWKHTPSHHQLYWAKWWRSIILIAPGWPNMPWFGDLVAMSSQIPLSLPNLPNLLTAIQSDPSQKSDKS